MPIIRIIRSKSFWICVGDFIVALDLNVGKYFSHGFGSMFVIDKITASFPRGRAYLTDQLQRAGTSISLNIAEGAGEFSTNEKSRFYRMAKRSGTETAAILDVAKRLDIIYLPQMSFRFLGDLIFLFRLSLKASNSLLYCEFLKIT